MLVCECTDVSILSLIDDWFCFCILNFIFLFGLC